MRGNVKEVVDAIRTVIGVQEKSVIPLHEPVFRGNEWKYVKDCLDTGWVSSVGSYVDRFEKELAKFTGVPFAVATGNGTSALHICLILSNVGMGDEVLIPTLTFVATANAVRYCGAIPHFVDLDPQTLGVDARKLKVYLSSISSIQGDICTNRETGRRIRAIVPVHIFGHPVDLDPLVEVCQEFKIDLIEDAAESLGSLYKGKHTGHWGTTSALSFNGNKIVTTGGGGAVLTSDQAKAKRAKHLTTTARTPHRWDFIHDETAFNYRLPNLNAALGCAQMEVLDQFVASKRSLAQRYREVFQGVKGLRFFDEPHYARSNYWLNTLLLDDAFVSNRNEIFELSHKEGIITRPSWTLLHHLPMYSDCPHMNLSQSENMGLRIVNIPSGPSLGSTQPR